MAASEIWQLETLISLVSVLLHLVSCILYLVSCILLLFFESCIVVFHRVKFLRAHGGCLGVRGRRRTWPAAISLGELQASFDPGVSEWGNLPRVMLRHLQSK